MEAIADQTIETIQTQENEDLYAEAIADTAQMLRTQQPEDAALDHHGFQCEVELDEGGTTVSVIPMLNEDKPGIVFKRPAIFDEENRQFKPAFTKEEIKALEQKIAERLPVQSQSSTKTTVTFLLKDRAAFAVRQLTKNYRALRNKYHPCTAEYFEAIRQAKAKLILTEGWSYNHED